MASLHAQVRAKHLHVSRRNIGSVKAVGGHWSKDARHELGLLQFLVEPNPVHHLLYVALHTRLVLMPLVVKLGHARLFVVEADRVIAE